MCCSCRTLSPSTLLLRDRPTERLNAAQTGVPLTTATMFSAARRLLRHRVLVLRPLGAAPRAAAFLARQGSLPGDLGAKAEIPTPCKFSSPSAPFISFSCYSATFSRRVYSFRFYARSKFLSYCFRRLISRNLLLRFSFSGLPPPFAWKTINTRNGVGADALSHLSISAEASVPLA